MTEQTKAIAVEDRAVEYVPFGAADKIKLSVNMVRQFIATPTRSGKLPNDRDCIKFLMLCKGKRANPFEGDCYLIGYDNKDGTAAFSMVSGVELFLKRAEQSDDYDGYESGVTIIGDEKLVIHRPGALVLPGEKLVGGWCNVYRKGRQKPICIVVDFNVYNTGRSRWERDPGGMIEKVAVSQAHRKAYPTALGGFYTVEELGDTGQLLSSTSDREPIAMPIAIATETTESNGPREITEAEKRKSLLDKIRVEMLRVGTLTADDVIAVLIKKHKQSTDIQEWKESALLSLFMELKKLPDPSGSDNMAVSTEDANTTLFS